MKQIEPYLSHIKAAIKTIEDYAQRMDFDQFAKDQKTQDAIIRQLEIIGEASSKITPKFIKANSQIPWREMKDFRNKLIHDYWELDIELIWNVVIQDIPLLKKLLNG